MRHLCGIGVGRGDADDLEVRAQELLRQERQIGEQRGDPRTLLAHRVDGPGDRVPLEDVDHDALGRALGQPPRRACGRGAHRGGRIGRDDQVHAADVRVDPHVARLVAAAALLDRDVARDGERPLGADARAREDVEHHVLVERARLAGRAPHPALARVEREVRRWRRRRERRVRAVDDVPLDERLPAQAAGPIRSGTR